jgi:protein-S-isoprenylcysteine O-methyltransferase Ste14
MIAARIGALTLVLLAGMVVTRTLLMRRQGIRAFKFGAIDRTDFLIPPFVLFYFYLILARAFRLPTPAHRTPFHLLLASWAGGVLCAAGLALFLAALISFGNSFRVGIDAEHPDKLVTSGIFAVTRNPIYVAFGLVLVGQFLIFPHWVLLVYATAGFFLLHRQVRREEDFMQSHYGRAFSEYRQRVPRYL